MYHTQDLYLRLRTCKPPFRRVISSTGVFAMDLVAVRLVIWSDHSRALRLPSSSSPADQQLILADSR